MTRVINFRPLFYCFLALAMGIGLAHFIFSFDWLVISLVACLSFGLLFVCYKKKCLKRFVCLVIAFCVGLGFFFIDCNSFVGNVYNGKVCTIFGRVSSDIVETDKYTILNLTNVQINGKKDNNLNLFLSISNINQKIQTGDYVTVNAGIYNEMLFENGEFNSFSYKRNTSYFAYAESEIVVSDGNLSISESFKLGVKNNLFEFMSSAGAGIGFSVLFGDKSSLDEEIQNNFSVAGIAHLLAVSGLHIGFLTLIVFFIINKFNLNAINKFLIVGAFLLIYAYLCGFNPSVVRASIMCLSVVFVTILGRQRDFLSSIGLAGIIILTISPLYVFDVGFQMSFASVTAIAVLARSFYRFFRRFKFPKYIAGALAVDLCSTLAILPLLAIYYENISVLTCFANLICIPIFAVAYMSLFVIAILSSILPFLSVFLFFPDLLLKIIIMITNVIVSLDWAVFNLFVFSILTAVMFYGILFLFSRFVSLKVSKKLDILCAVGCLGIVLFCCFCTPFKANEFTYTQLNTSEPCAIITTNKNQILMVGGTQDLDYVKKYLRYKNITKIDGVIPLEEVSFRNADLDKFVKQYKVENVFLNIRNRVQLGNFTIEMFYENDLKKLLYIGIDDTDFVFVVGQVGKNQAVSLKEKLVESNIVPTAVFCKSNSLCSYEICKSDFVFSKDKFENSQTPNFATNLISSFTFSFDNGNIREIRSVN